MPNPTTGKTGLALSVRQPWAWLIVHGLKDVENRTWPTRVRGWVAIHAGKTIDRDAFAFIAEHYPDIRLPESFETGGIVGRARLVDCVEDMDSRWFYGPYGFVVRDAEPLPFMPCRGRLGFFRPELREGSKE